MLVDSNILIYALNNRSPKVLRARKFLNDNLQDIKVTPQNFLETYRIITHTNFPNTLSPSDAFKVINSLINHFEIIYPRPDTFKLYKKIIDVYAINSNQTYDAYLIATMVSNGVDTLATDNIKDFKIFKSITVYNPFAVSEATQVHDQAGEEYG